MTANRLLRVLCLGVALLGVSILILILGFGVRLVEWEQVTWVAIAAEWALLYRMRVPR